MFSVEKYCDGKEEEWDDFVLNRSMNGTFLQTRRFINYHKKGKFEDSSLMFYKGNTLVAVILANIHKVDNNVCFYSHGGTTFGGVIISNQVYSTSKVNEIMDLLEQNIRQMGCDSCYIKQSPRIFENENTDLLSYYFFQKGYSEYIELNFYMDLKKYKEDILRQFSSSKRRDYRYSLKNGFEFKKLDNKKEIEEYYNVLQLNLKKLGLQSVHSYEDLIELKFNRFNESIEFYGVYLDEKIVAGSMVFIFGCNIFHTQYLSSDERYLELYSMDFLIFHLIKEAVDMNMNTFTFGICTEDQGRYLNLSLSRFKEGFGAKYCLNKSYEKYFYKKTGGIAMRNIDDYSAKYMIPSFEDYQVKYRRKMILEQIEHYAPRRILEIGCGYEPLFKYVKNIEFTVVEPSKQFYESALAQAQGRNSTISIVNKKIEECAKDLELNYDMIICSSLIHEVEKPQQLLDAIVSLCNDETVIHINCPNANSMHRLLAVESGFILNIHDMSKRNKALQQANVFDINMLTEMIKESNLEVMDQGTYFIKPFTHEQMFEMIKNNIINSTFPPENLVQLLDNSSKMLQLIGALTLK